MSKISESVTDVGKSLMSLDMTKMADEMTRIMAKVNVPGIDMDSLVAMQRENMEALTAANQAALEGLKAVAEWEVKVLKATMEEVSNAAGALSKVRSPQDVVTEQTEAAKEVFKSSVSNLRELAEILNHANKSASRAIVDRVPSGLDEIKEVLKIKE
ncbi:MAG: phasin family protein [Chromatiaceae bacterium]|jgi:phasin family protein|nr:phasin family protein [Chromatiaceae bacterium]